MLENTRQIISLGNARPAVKSGPALSLSDKSRLQMRGRALGGVGDVAKWGRLPLSVCQVGGVSAGAKTAKIARLAAGKVRRTARSWTGTSA